MLSILLTIALIAANQTGSVSAPDLLQRGKDNFRAGQYAAAVDDLRAAADAFLTAEQKQQYVRSGRLDMLPQLEEALVYLTVAYARMGRDADARETIGRIAAAEKIEPHYASLALTGDVSEFPAIAARLAPAVQLPANPQLASAAPVPPAPPAPSPAPIAPQATIAQTTTTTTTTATSDREAIMREVDRRVAEARAQMQKEMAERLAAERAEMERQINERVAAATAAAERDAERRVAESQSRRDVLTNLRRAEILANTGHLGEANDIYLSIANATAATREAITEAAIGLYRTGNYTAAVPAFRRLGTFARGEEDLRYYNAVSLYETGQYDQASKELACALPYLQVTQEVERYQAKIEAASAKQVGH